MLFNITKFTENNTQTNFSDIHPPFETQEAALVEANRCMFCYDAPCTKSCPTGINVPKFIKQIATENIKGSAHTIFVSNILVEDAARFARLKNFVKVHVCTILLDEEPIAIAKLQRYSTEKPLKKKWQMFDRKDPNRKKSGHRWCRPGRTFLRACAFPGRS